MNNQNHITKSVKIIFYHAHQDRGSEFNYNEGLSNAEELNDSRDFYRRLDGDNRLSMYLHNLEKQERSIYRISLLDLLDEESILL